ncbi:MAG: choice-of-anchor I domain-containing protein, partial [Terrimicrobiaceae bacterium]
TKVTNLGTITQTIDANDTGTPVISISQSVKGLPMPDSVATYTAGGKTYVVSANEGDARVDDRDLSRFGDVAGNDSMNGIVDTDGPSNFLNSSANANNGVRADAQWGRLNISRLDGDTDADGKIDAPTMIGTRSMSIWEVTAGGLTRVYDTGSLFETYISLNDTAGWVDSRSDDKGPEPEGLTLGEIAGRTYAFIGMERTNGIFMLDVTDPANVTMTGYHRIVVGNGAGSSGTPYRPESLSFVSAADSSNGQNLLIVGFEGDGTNAVSEQIAIFSVVPEPSTAWLLGVAGVALALRRRARRVAA